MSLDDQKIKQYWRAMSALSDRLVADTQLIRDWAGELPAQTEGDSLQGVVADLSQKFGDDFFLASRSRRRSRSAAWPPSSSAQLVSKFDNRFVDGLSILIDELRTRLTAMPEGRSRNAVLAMLSDDVHTLASRFGSFTAAWDHLVILKFETSIPDVRRRKFDAWFTAAVGTAERFIRDAIGLTILLPGRELVAEPLAECFASEELAVPHPTLDQVLLLPSAEAILTDSVMSYMDRDAEHTISYASAFASALGTALFAPSDRGFRPGVLDQIPFLTGSCAQAWAQLVGVRRSIVHETTEELRSGAGDPLREELYGLGLDSLRLIPDFLCAMCYGFATRMMVEVGSRAERDHRGLVDALRRQLSGELRVLVMRLLNAARHELAWALINEALEIEPPDSRGLMLRLNSYFARLQFDRERVDMNEIETMDVGDTPRYVLLKAVLLGNLERERLAPVLERAVASGDLSLEELRTWPALGALRECPWWSEWTRTNDRP